VYHLECEDKPASVGGTD